MSTKNYVFCGYPSAFIHENSDPNSAKKKHLFWGDTIEILGEEKNGFLKVYSRDETGWIKKTDTQENPILDLIFLDVGQGDSCIIVTPEDEKIIVDAGIGNHLLRYLRWRYRSFSTPEMKQMAGNIKSIIITHPDEDHYEGLKYLFEDTLMNKVLKVQSIYHNGIFPRKGEGAGSLGTSKRFGQKTFITDLIFDDDDLNEFLENRPLWQGKVFATLVDSIKRKHHSIDFHMLNHEWSGSPQLTASQDLAFGILGPYVEKVEGKLALRYFGDVQKTKNGHSVLLLLKYGDIKIFLSGDLNDKAEDYLIQQYGSKSIFQAEVLKIAHHGSSSFSDQFMEAVKPYVSVISSGDTESYSHPRADTLGLIGKMSRGARPLIFSTELARSTPEYFSGFSNLNKDIEKLKKALLAPNLADEEKKKMSSELDVIKDKILNRAVAVYGAINLRTDGHNLLLCQKLEEKNPQDEEWDIYLLEPDEQTKELKLASLNK
jgi:beta-lactamase superfamily II metal-dependent hydrolase